MGGGDSEDSHPYTDTGAHVQSWPTRGREGESGGGGDHRLEVKGRTRRVRTDRHRHTPAHTATGAVALAASCRITLTVTSTANQQRCACDVLPTPSIVKSFMPSEGLRFSFMRGTRTMTRVKVLHGSCRDVREQLFNVIFHGCWCGRPKAFRKQDAVLSLPLPLPHSCARHAGGGAVFFTPLVHCRCWCASLSGRGGGGRGGGDAC